MSDWVPLLVEATAYCPCKKCCGQEAHGVTANQTKTSDFPYNLAGDIYNFSFNDEVYIPIGSGALDIIRRDDRVFKIDDRGGGLNTESKSSSIPRIDLRVKDHWWAKQFGRKRIIVFVRHV